LRIVEHRVLVPSIFTRRPSLLAPLPFHLHAAADGYVVLHGACEGHVRLARRAGNAVLQPGDVATWVAAAVRPAA
ncbi:MAG: hypothetical protein ACXVY5_04050, partial [Gaiellales bacterium]